MILASSEILKRLEKGEIFRPRTWDRACIREASYVLRVAPDGLWIEGAPYPPGKCYDKGEWLTINPGKIAILSTIESLDMPADLVGHQGIRFDPAVSGLTGLMGIQVDPLFGSDYNDERLYLRVANLGNTPITIKPGDAVFNIEFVELKGDANREKKRERMWDRLVRTLKDQTDPSWSHVTQVQANVDRQIQQAQRDLDRQVEGVRQGLQPVVMFGVFLVAATLLGVVISFILNFRGIPPNEVPQWVTRWGWIVVVVAISGSALATVAIAIITAILFFTRKGIIGRWEDSADRDS